jgi:hypothetical protein
MTKFIIAYDDKDPKLGHYFTLCKENLTTFLNEKGISPIIEIPTQHCTQLSIELEIKKHQASESFCFVAYSHGNKNSVICSGESYVKVNENTHLFNNSIFYSNACLCGRELRIDLIQNGCKVFIGSNEEVQVFLLDPHLSAKLDNYALLLFIEDDKTIHEAYISMLNHYDYEIDRLNSFEKGLGFGKAAYLVEARDALVFEGDKALKFSSL